MNVVKIFGETLRQLGANPWIWFFGFVSLGWLLLPFVGTFPIAEEYPTLISVGALVWLPIALMSVASLMYVVDRVHLKRTFSFEHAWQAGRDSLWPLVSFGFLVLLPVFGFLSLFFSGWAAYLESPLWLKLMGIVVGLWLLAAAGYGACAIVLDRARILDALGAGLEIGIGHLPAIILIIVILIANELLLLWLAGKLIGVFLLNNLLLTQTSASLVVRLLLGASGVLNIVAFTIAFRIASPVSTIAVAEQLDAPN